MLQFLFMALKPMSVIDMKLREQLKTANVTICAAVKDEDLFIDERQQFGEQDTVHCWKQPGGRHHGPLPDQVVGSS